MSKKQAHFRFDDITIRIIYTFKDFNYANVYDDKAVKSLVVVWISFLPAKPSRGDPTFHISLKVYLFPIK